MLKMLVKYLVHDVFVLLLSKIDEPPVPKLFIQCLSKALSISLPCTCGDIFICIYNLSLHIFYMPI